MKLLGRILCAITRKHLRMRRVTPKDVQVEHPVYRCGRCGKLETRKAKRKETK